MADAGVQVGVYHTREMGDIPALYVGDPPKGTTVDGLEITIHQSSKPRIISTLGGNIVFKDWLVRVIKHDRKADIDAAVQAIAAAFDPVPTPQFIPEAGDIAEQVLFTIPDDPE